MNQLLAAAVYLDMSRRCPSELEVEYTGVFDLRGLDILEIHIVSHWLSQGRWAWIALPMCPQSCTQQHWTRYTIPSFGLWPCWVEFPQNKKGLLPQRQALQGQFDIR